MFPPRYCKLVYNQMNWFDISTIRKILGLQTLENHKYLFCHSGVILLYFFLSLYCHFGNGKMHKNPLKMTPSLGNARDDKKQQKMTKKRQKMTNK